MAKAGCGPVRRTQLQKTLPTASRWQGRCFGEPCLQQGTGAIRIRHLRIRCASMKGNEVSDRTFQLSQAGAARPACSQVYMRLLRASSRSLSIDNEQDLLVR